MKTLKTYVLIMTLALFCNAEAETLQDIIDDSHNRAVWLDYQRFPDSILTDFINDRQRTISIIGTTNQKLVTWVPGVDTSKFLIPSDFYLLEAVELNADPQEAIGGTNFQKGLKFVPKRDLGKYYTRERVRPTTFSIWGDTLYLNRATWTGFDTLHISYFAYARDMIHADSVVDLPDAYISLLKDYVLVRCLFRVSIAVPDTLDRSVAFQEAILLGRSRDER